MRLYEHIYIYLYIYNSMISTSAISTSISSISILSHPILIPKHVSSLGKPRMCLGTGQFCYPKSRIQQLRDIPHICMYVWMDGWMHACMYVRTYVCMYLCMYIKYTYVSTET